MNRTFLSGTIYPTAYCVQRFDSFLAEFTRTNNCKSDVSLNNKTQAKKVYEAFMNWMSYKAGESLGFVFRSVGINNAFDFTAYVYDNASSLENEHADLNKFKDFQLTKAELAYQSYKEKHAAEFEGIEDEDAEERDLVIYDRYNPATHKIYRFSGKRGKNTDHQVNMHRVDFHYETKTKYYNCYSCLYSYYIEHKKDLEHYADYIGIND